MKEKLTWSLWAGMYLLCAFLGMAGQPEGAGKLFFTLTALIFFIPGGLLLYWAVRDGKRKQRLAVRWIALGSLALTLILLVANFCSVLFSQAVGNALYVLLVLVSAPMVCSQYWVASLFLWACLLMASFLKNNKAEGSQA